MRVAPIDVWRVCLTRSPAEDIALQDCLHPDEHARAMRFRFQRDRDRFVASRGSLRHILAHYLDQPPARLRFGYAVAGKPFLTDHPHLQFNLSHAADLALVAVSTGGPVGVDIEEIQSDTVVDSTSSLVLSPPERNVLRRLSGQPRRERFARFWTRKEAYIKADGRGMQLPLDEIDVATSADRVLVWKPETSRWASCPDWTLRSLSVAPGHAAAVAAEGSGWEIVEREWTGPGRRESAAGGSSHLM